MKKIYFIFGLVFFAFAVQSQELSYFTAQITAEDSLRFQLTNVYFICQPDSGQYFKCRQGKAVFNLNFSRVDSLVFKDAIPAEVSGYRTGEVVLISGEKMRLELLTHWALRGDNSGIGGRMEIPVSDISGIKFLYGGIYKKCPQCGLVLYNYEKENCPFDEERLKE